MTRRTCAVALACGLLAVLTPPTPTLTIPIGSGLDLCATDTSVKPCPDWGSFGDVYERNLSVQATWHWSGPLADTPEFRQALGCPPNTEAAPNLLW